MGLSVRGQTAGETRTVPQVVDPSKEDWFIRSARHWGREHRWLYHRLHRTVCELEALRAWIVANDYLSGWLDIDNQLTANDLYWRRRTRAGRMTYRKRRITDEMARIQALAQGLAKGKSPALAEAMRAAWYAEKMAQFPPDRRPSKEPL